MTLFRGASWRLYFGLWLIGSYSGCSCESQVSTTATSIVIEFPEDGRVLTSSDDRSDSTPGIQIDVRAVTSGLADGATLILSNSVNGDTVSGQIAGNQVVFSGANVPTLPPSEQIVLRVALEGVVATDACDRTRCDEVRVRVLVNTCQFTDPQDGATLTADAYPDATDPFDPFESDVSLLCSGTDPGDFVALIVNGGLPIVAQLDNDNRVTFARVALGEGPNALTALPDTDAAGASPLGTPSSATVTVSTGRCTSTVQPGDGSRLLADADIDPSLTGMQATIDVLTDCADTSLVTFYARGAGLADWTELFTGTPSLLQDVTTHFRLDAVNLPESILPFDVEVLATIDEGGGGRRGASLVSRYWVDSLRPTLLSASPTDLSCIGPAQDADTAIPGTQVLAFGTVSGAEDGSEVWLTSATAATPAPTCAVDTDCTAPLLCRETACRTVLTVSAGAFQSASLTLPEGVSTLEYVALDPAGNKSQASMVTLSSFSAAPVLTITDPQNGAILDPSADLDGVSDGLQYLVQVSVENIPAGAEGSLLISGQLPVPFTPPAGAAGVAPVVVTLEDGSRALTAIVEDLCGDPISSAAVNVTASSVPLAVAITGYDNDLGGFSGRHVIADGGATAGADIALDIFTGLGAADRELTVSFSDAFTIDGGGLRSCTGAATQADQIFTVTASEQGRLLDPLTLAAGTNCITASLDDGIQVVGATYVVEQRSSTSVAIAFTTTAPLGADSNATAPGFNHTLVLSLSPGDTLPGVVSLDVASLYTYEVDTLPGQTTVTLTDFSLPDGAYDIIAEYRDQLGNTSAPATLSVTVNESAGPDIIIAAPAHDEFLDNADFILSVALIGASSTPTTCDVFVDGVVDPGFDDAAWAGGSSSNYDPVLTEGSHDLRVECTDGAATGISQTVRVNIDDSAPNAPTFVDEAAGAPGRLVFSPPGFINGLTPDTSSVAGLQHAISIEVDVGAATTVDGWLARLTVTPPGGSPTVYTRPLILVGSTAMAAFVAADLGTTDGSVAFAAEIEDAAGNVSTSTTVNLAKDTQAPIIARNEPTPSTSLFDEGDDIDSSTALVDLPFTFTVTGGVLGADCGTTSTQCLSLNVIPTPSRTPAALPIIRSLQAGTTTFGSFGFADGLYSALTQVHDAAGNPANRVDTFQVQSIVPLLERTLPTGTTLTAAFNGNFAFNAAGFLTGTQATLCSSVQPPGNTTGQLCRWATDGTTTGTPKGFVVTTGVLTGADIREQNVFFSGVVLAQGSQLVWAEAREIDNSPDLHSLLETFVVDTQAPTVSAIDLTSNNTGNDDGTTLRLNASEGTPSGGTLTTPVTLTLGGGVVGQPARVYSNVPAPNTLVGELAALTDAGTATFNIALTQGQHTLTGWTRDENGNVSTGGPSLTVEVDVTAGTASVPLPSISVYRAVHGTFNDGGTPGVPGDDVFTIGVTVALSDNMPLDGGSVTLARFAAASGGSALSSANQDLTATGTSGNATFATFALVPGVNYLEATFTDASGNAFTSTPRRAYRVDLYGPTLTLTAVSNTGTPLTCTQGSPCVVTTLAPNNNRVQLDIASNDLAFTLTGCSNSDVSIEDCDASTISVSLQSRLGGSSGAFSPVFNGAFATTAASGGTINATTNCGAGYTGQGCSMFDKAPGFALDPGTVREVRLIATDLSGNQSVSSSAFLQISLDGVVIETERLTVDMNPVSGRDVLESPDFFAGAVQATTGSQLANIAAPPAFATNFRVNLTPVGGSTPVRVEITGSNGTQSCDDTQGCWQASPLTADFQNVGLTESDVPPYTPNTLTVTVYCGASPPGAQCSQTDYDDIVADTQAPQWSFDRCDLCGLGVPMVNQAGATIAQATCAAQCGSFGTDDGDLPSSGRALWNRAGNPATGIAGDQDSGTATTYSVRTTPALRVDLVGTDDDQIITLSSTNQGGLSGNQVLASSDVATFNALEVPSLAGSAFHRLAVSFTDLAGNAAIPDITRTAHGSATVEEAIYAITDTIPPSAASPGLVACIGESTTPTSGATPATTEDAACAAACTSSGSCSRRKGEATLVFAAPSEDNGSGGAASSYQVLVAARHIAYGATTYATCSEIDDDVLTSPEPAATSAPSPGTPGAQQIVSVADLYPHRNYCFAVAAVDDAGNRTLSVVERSMPLLTTIPGAAGSPPPPQQMALNPASPDDNPATSAFATGAATRPGYRMSRLGDMDGDGRDDFAVAEIINTVAPIYWQVNLYLSAAGAPNVADYSIRAPTNDAGGQFFFGASYRGIASGFVNQDTLADLIICSPSHDGAFTDRGAVFVYYGVAGTGINAVANGPPDDPDLPSFAPSEALYGNAANARLCEDVVVANVDGVGGDDIIMATRPDAALPRVFGFFAGHSARFNEGGGDDGKIIIDTANVGSGWSAASPSTAPVNPNWPDLVLQPQTGYRADFPSIIAAADVDGDGIQDIAVSDVTANHGGASCGSNCSGEVFIFKGGASLAGLVGPPSCGAVDCSAFTRPPQLLQILRANSSTNAGRFGNRIFTIPAPRAGTDDADWLAVQSQQAGAHRIYLFRGKEGVGIVRVVGDTLAADIPANGWALADYRRLDDRFWDTSTFCGASCPQYGATFDAVGVFDGHGGPDLLVGAGATTHAPTGAGALNNRVFFYSFDEAACAAAGSEAACTFVKRAILRGPAIDPSPPGPSDFFGAQVAGAGNYLGLSGDEDTQLLITTNSAEPVGRVHIYR